MAVFIQKWYNLTDKYVRDYVFESKTRFSLVLIIIFVYIIIVTFLHVAADWRFWLISNSCLKLLENYLTCLYIMNIDFTFEHIL